MSTFRKPSAVFILLVLVTCGNSAPPAGIVGWWRLDGNGADSSGKNHALILSGPNFSQGKVGQPPQLDGIDDFARDTANPDSDLGANDGFSAEMPEPRWNLDVVARSVGSHAGDHFMGRIDELTMYKRALSESEIDSIYAAGSPGDISADAQLIVVPKQYVNTDGGTASGSGLLRQAIRLQDCYAATNFPTAPVWIREVRFRPSAVYGQPFSATISNLQINMSTTPRQPEALTGIFAQNVGSDETIVFQGAASISSAFVGPPNGPKAFDIVIPLQTPFLYDSSRGNLLIDFRNFSGSSATFIDAGPGVGDGASRVFAANASSTIATSVDTGAEILAFVYEPETGVPPVAVSNFDLARDFSTNRNPNGVWSYGWQTNIGGTLNLLTHSRTAFADNGVPHQLWEFVASGGPPIISFFPFTNAATGVSGGGQGQFPPGTVSFYAGNDGTPQNFATIRFIAPSNGTYRIGVAVRSVWDGSLAGDADFHVAHNSTEIFGQFLPALGAAAYTNTLALVSGDRIDFAVGRGTDRTLFGSALKIAAVITPTNAVTGGTNPPPPGLPGLVSLWRGESNALDSIGSNHGVLVNNVGFAPGISGQAFRLDGTNFIRVPDSDSLGLSNELTIAMWFSREELPLNAGYTLIDKRNLFNCNFGANMAQNTGFQLYYNDPTVNVGNQFEISASPLPPANIWHYFAGTFRQLTGTTIELRTYMNGRALKTNTLGGNLANTTNNAPVAIGSARDGVSEYFKGLIDEVAIYNYALNPSQVLSNYNAFELRTARLLPVALLDGTGFRFQIDRPLNQPYVVETSTNLVQWSAVQTSVITNIPGRLIITDSNSPVTSQRFYRLRAP